MRGRSLISKEYFHNYYLENRESLSQNMKDYYQKNKLRIKKLAKEWATQNPEKMKESQRKHRKIHIEEVRIYQKKWMKEYRKDPIVKKKLRLSNKEWKENHKELVNHMNRERSYRKRKAWGFHSLEEWEKLKLKFNYCCAICGGKEPFTNQYRKFLTEDHIIPLIRGGSDFIENIQPLCSSCNSKKSSHLSKI